MKRILLLSAVLFSAIAGSSQDHLVVDPNAEMRKVNGSFNSIRVSGGIDLYLTQSETEAVAVSASEDKFKPGIKTVVENNTLRIYFEGDKGWSMKNRQIKAYVSFKTLEILEVSGASDVVVAGRISGSKLTMKFSGSSDFKGTVAVNSLLLDLSGASDVKIEGTATELTIHSSGASDVDGYGLITDLCKAHATGASDIDITVNKELIAHASGASEISYRGSGILKEVHKSGASSVGKKG
jgi:hypothetical protein